MPAELLAVLPSPSLYLVAQHFVGMALQHDYLSTGRGHHQSHRAITGRNQALTRLSAAPLAHSSSDLGVWPAVATQAPPRSFTDAEQQYLAHVATQPRLSSAEEYGLAKRMRTGDISARNALIQANLGLVVMFARRYLRPGLPLLDLVAEGNLGLFTSADRFDPEMGFRFATYAKWWVLHGIRSVLKRFNESQGMPAPTSSCDAPEAHLPDVAGRDPETATAWQVEGTIDAADPEQEPPQIAQINQRSILLKRAMEMLSERERAIVSARYALAGEDEQTLAMLAGRFNLSIERVRQIERSALQKLAQSLGELGVSADCLF